jgi:hypothetical protein
LSGHLVAAIGQDLEREVTGADQLTVVLGQLRGDSDQRGAQRRDLGQDRL